MFKCSPYGDEVDLDDPNTYSYLPDDVKLLDDMMFKDIGYALCYMDYFHPEMFPKKKTESKDLNGASYSQRIRVYNLIKEFTNTRHFHYSDVLWYKEKVFLFQDEIENMC